MSDPVNINLTCLLDWTDSLEPKPIQLGEYYVVRLRIEKIARTVKFYKSALIYCDVLGPVFAFIDSSTSVHEKSLTDGMT